MMAFALMAPAAFSSADAADQTPKLVTEQFMTDPGGIRHAGHVMMFKAILGHWKASIRNSGDRK
jgi:hypothetical protein